MFTFDNTTIIISVVLLLVALLTSFLNPFFRKVRIAEYGLPTSTAESEEISKEDNRDRGVSRELLFSDT